MAVPVRLQFVAEAAQAAKATLGQIDLIRMIRTETAETSSVATAAARENVANLVKQREELRANLAAYKQLAMGAKAGSDEQIAANKLAADSARQLGIAYKEAGLAAATSGKRGARAAEESRFARGFASKADGVASYGMATPAFIGGALIGLEMVRATRNALDAQVSIAGLDNAIKRARASSKLLRPVLEDQAAAARRLGFTDDETRESESKLITAFGATKHSLGEVSIAEDLARKTKMNLGDATKQLILLQEGNARAAKQFGLSLPTLTAAEWARKAAADHLNVTMEKGKTLYDQLIPRIRGAAKAYAETPTGQMAEFRAEVQKIEEEVGRAFIPTLRHMLRVIVDWLSKTENQKRLVRDVTQFIGFLVAMIKTAISVIQAMLRVVNPLVGALGGWKNVLLAIISIKLAMVVQGWSRELVKFAGQSATATTKSGALLANIKGLARMTALTIGITMLFSTKGEGAKGIIAAMLTGGAIGASFGPMGALLGSLAAGTAALAINVFLHKPGENFFDTTAGFLQDEGKNPDGSGPLYRARPGHPGYPQRVKGGWDYGPGASGDPVQLTKNGMPVGPKYGDIIYENGHYYGIDLKGKKHRLTIGEVAHLLGQTKKQVANAAANADVKGAASPTSAAIVQSGEKLGGQGGGTYVSGGGHQSGAVKVGSALDCSGFIYQSLLRAGVKGFSYVTAATQFAALQRGGGGNWAAESVGVQGAMPGDLVYWDNLTSETQPGHCGIVVSGHGQSAKVMQYENSHDGSGVTGIGVYPVMGVFRVSIIKGRGGSPYGPSTTTGGVATAPGPSPVPIISGANLISQSTRNAISRAAAKVKTTTGQEEIHWLRVEQGDLRDAQTQLRRELTKARGKQKAAIEAEMRAVAGQIATVQKSILTAVAHSLRGTLQTVQARADAAFQARTEAYIQNVLGPRFFQGTDEHGNQRMTPTEARLAAMQLQDSRSSLSDQLAQAQKQLQGDLAAGAAVSSDQIVADQKAVEQAQRAIDENELSIKATKERAQADADYAEAVKKYERERSLLEQQLNKGLADFYSAVARGTKGLNGLADVLARFGLAKDDVNGQPGKGDGRGPGHHGGSSGSGGGPSVGPGLSLDWLLKYAIPQADGGDWMVRKPTLFLAGESGLERATFTPGGGGPGGGDGGGTVVIENLTVIGTTPQEVGRALARIVTPAQRRQVGFTSYTG